MMIFILLNTANHPAMVAGIADGIDEYFSIVEPLTAARGQHLGQLYGKTSDSVHFSFGKVRRKLGNCCYGSCN